MDIDQYLPLLPPVTNANRPYWDGLRAGELRLQVCGNCGMQRFPESGVCPRCLSTDASWQPASGRATLWSWIVMHQRYFDAFADELPYNVAFVRLEEGPFMISALVDPPADLQVDEPLQLVVVPLTDEVSLPKFTVAR